MQEVKHAEQGRGICLAPHPELAAVNMQDGVQA